MTTTIKTEQLETPKVIDDLGLDGDKMSETKEENLDDDKVAALKQKMAKKPKKEEEKPSELATSLKFGVIGLGQAGCIDGNTNIYVSEFGFIPIENFFYNMLNSVNLCEIQTTNDKQTCISIKDKNIYTVSIDPQTGNLKKCKITHVWKNRTISKNRITTEDNTTLICSKKHPSLVLRSGIRNKADFVSLSSPKPLSVGDRLFDTRLEVLDQLSEPTFIKEIEVTEDVAWLLGIFAGDGHDKLNGNEISFYCDNESVVERISYIINNIIPNSSIRIKPQPGCQQVCVYGLQAKVFFESAFKHDTLKTYGGLGKKTYTVEIPQCISIAKSNIRAAFLAGMIDSDGTIAKDWCESSIFTVSPKMSDQLGCLISSIGGRSSVRVIAPRRENEATGYKVSLSGKLNHGPMIDVIIQNITHSVKKDKLIRWIDNDQKSFTTSCVPISYNEIKDYMDEGGMINVNNLTVKSNICIKSWANNKQLLSIPSFNKMIDSLEETDQLQYIKIINPKLTCIKSIECVDELECQFFDLTVEEHENYVAGNNGLLFTHNSRVAEQFNDLGYPTIVANTATQDLVHIKVPEENKLFMDIGLQGAAKNMDRGQDAAEQYREEFLNLINSVLDSTQAIVVATSCGGGSGAGSLPVVIDLLQSIGKPIVVIGVLPMVSEDVKTKSNSIDTISKLAEFVNSGKVHNVIIVDNSRIESIYSGVGQMEFFKVANKAIVDPIHAFNAYSMMPSDVKGLDSAEWGTLLLNGEGLSVYGQLSLASFDEDTSIAEGIISSLSDNLLASSFDLERAKYVGFLVVANEKVWSKVPAGAINYASIVLSDTFGSPEGLFKGIYSTENLDDVVKIYTFVSGLALPEVRLNALKKEVASQQEALKQKSKERTNKLNVDVNKDTAVFEVEKLKQKIASKVSGFGKLDSIVDRRRK